MPVIDVRQRLALPPKPLDPGEFLVLMQVDDRAFALRVDDVDDLVELQGGLLESSASVSPALRGLAGLAPSADGVLVIHDPATFVSQAESEAIDAALSAHP